MRRRVSIGLLFQYHENWIGGSYYLLNLIYSLARLPEEDQPHLHIFYYQASDIEKIKQTGYERLDFTNLAKPLKSWQLIVNKISRVLDGGRQVIDWRHDTSRLQAIFPNPLQNVFENAKHKLYWIPDMQDKFFPQYFNEAELKDRDDFYKKIAYSGEDVIFSSQDSMNQFNQFYPKASVRKHVLNFAVTHPQYSQYSLSQMREKYNLPLQYFIVPNQFWQHKNHQLVIDAMDILQKQGEDIVIIFTGKEFDYRNPDYANTLKEMVRSKGLAGNILFLGFIDRSEQLFLMKNALAIIQPSLFEGWSTVVEDAKSMNQQLIISDIPIHREQVTDNVLFFDCMEPLSLANTITSFLDSSNIPMVKDYENNIRAFGSNFLSIVKEMNVC